jgi:hypothetical protein
VNSTSIVAWESLSVDFIITMRFLCMFLMECIFRQNVSTSMINLFMLHISRI